MWIFLLVGVGDFCRYQNIKEALKAPEKAQL